MSAWPDINVQYNLGNFDSVIIITACNTTTEGGREAEVDRG